MAKHKKRYLDITHEMCEQAVLDAYNDKWLRSDFLLTAGKYSGVSKNEIISQRKNGEVWYQLDIAKGIAYEMEERIEALVSGEADDLDLDPVVSEQRYDTMANKYREISRCCPMHLCFAHLAVKALMPLLRARITPFQHASIPKRGQTACKRQIERFLRRKALRISHAKKLDVKKAYPSTKAEIIISILKDEIPKATVLLLIVTALLSMSPNGGLIIGGYLEAWLFNLVMSYVLRYIMSLKKYKRGEEISLVKKCAAYMDDTMLLGSRLADLRSAARKSGVYMKEKYGLSWKEKSDEISLLSINEEH